MSLASANSKLGPQGHGRKLSLATGCRFDYRRERPEGGEQPGSCLDAGWAVIGVGPRWGLQGKRRRLDACEKELIVTLASTDGFFLWASRRA